MDRLIYIAGGGAARTLEHQAALSNNMANVSTPGFRAQLAAYRAVPITLQGQDAATTTRVASVAATANNKLEQGALQTTGRNLDVAIQGDGWFAVQTPDGEAYTRAGALQRSADGLLVTATGRPVLSAQGEPIDLGDSERIAFDRDGGINARPRGGRPRDVQRVAQIKLVNPDPATLVRGEDGLFRSLGANGQAVAAPADAQVRVLGGALEGSNVSAAENMVGLIENARRFEMQMKMIADANQNEQKANSILSSGG
jgi:flagellar basal-body rod protein FlgF